MIVFYGSQTGTAEDFATRLAKDSVRYGMKKGMSADPEEYDMVGGFIGAAFLAISLCGARHWLSSSAFCIVPYLRTAN